MDLDATKNKEPPKPPSIGMIVAMFLEVMIVFTFFMSLPERTGILGLALCVAYTRFCATWAFLMSKAD